MQATKFGHSLRRSLWAEHLGIQDNLAGHPAQYLDDHLGDPVCAENFEGQWLKIAEQNTAICNKYFLEQPADHHIDLNTYKLTREIADHEIQHHHQHGGHVEAYRDKVRELHECGLDLQPREKAIEAVEAIQGHLYKYPLNFLGGDLAKGNLKPGLTDAEGVIPAKTFT